MSTSYYTDPTETQAPIEARAMALVMDRYPLAAFMAGVWVGTEAESAQQLWTRLITD